MAWNHRIPAGNADMNGLARRTQVESPSLGAVRRRIGHRRHEARIAIVAPVLSVQIFHGAGQVDRDGERAIGSARTFCDWIRVVVGRVAVVPPVALDLVDSNPPIGNGLAIQVSG